MNKKKGADAWVIPECLNNDSFLAKWGEYIQHRKEKRSNLTPTAGKAALKKLAEMGPAKAVEALTNSISNGWTGVFPPDNEKSSAKPKKYSRGTQYDPNATG